MQHEPRFQLNIFFSRKENGDQPSDALSQITLAAARSGLNLLLRNRVVDVAVPTAGFAISGLEAVHSVQQFIGGGRPESALLAAIMGGGTVVCGYLAARNANVTARVGRLLRR